MTSKVTIWTPGCPLQAAHCFQTFSTNGGREMMVKHSSCQQFKFRVAKSLFNSIHLTFLLLFNQAKSLIWFIPWYSPNGLRMTISTPLPTWFMNTFQVFFSFFFFILRK
jgi:hypothetical protein